MKEENIVSETFLGKEIIVEIVDSIDKGKNKLIITCIISFCFLSLLFSLTVGYIINEIYNYDDYPNVENTNTQNVDLGSDK